MSLKLCGMVAGTALLLAACGCATTPPRTQVPTGTWTGQGLFVAEQWNEPANDGTQTLRSRESRTYTTSLKTATTGTGDVAIVSLEIRSERGPIANLDGDQTRIAVRLKPVTTVDSGRIVVYHITDYGLSLDAKPPELKPSDHQAPSASCMRVGSDVVLRIQYMQGFEDTYRFAGDTVYKDGILEGKGNLGFVHWSEALHRQP